LAITTILLSDLAEFIAVDECHSLKVLNLLHWTGILSVLVKNITIIIHFNPNPMKIVYIAEEEELKALVRSCIREEIESILQGMNQQEPVPERINLIEAAQYLGVKKSTMYKLTMTRKIPFCKFGRRIIFYTKELDEWIKQNAIRLKQRKNWKGKQQSI